MGLPELSNFACLPSRAGGFAHSGRFSRDYHILFGEYPLEALAAAV
jgi:hypothetical protein